MNQLFQLVKTCPQNSARAGVLSTPHGSICTPCFMPVGSQGTVKTLTPDEIRATGAQIILGNTYHLYLRPGMDIIGRFGGLHRFMGWDGPILTDSGGFQVFSLGHLRKVSDEGVLFRSHIDGSEHFLTPELAIQLQEKLGADIIMPLDECPPYGGDFGHIRAATERTHLWARRCKETHRKEGQALFGIVQGGTFPELRKESAAFFTSLDFSGYSIGGLSIGEPKQVTYSILSETSRWLPEDRPRYLMGVGSPEDLVECVARGVDMFDSALPTRVARNGALFTRTRRHNIANARFRDMEGPVDPGCDCYACRNFSAAYLYHLFKCQELLAYRLATIHNVRFMIRLMGDIRAAIVDGTFSSFKEEFLAGYQPTNEEVRTDQKQKWLEVRSGRGRLPNSSDIHA